MKGQGKQGVTRGLIPYMEDGEILTPEWAHQMTSWGKCQISKRCQQAQNLVIITKMSTIAFMSYECLCFAAFLCGHIQVHQRGLGWEPVIHLLLQEQTQRSNAGPQSFVGLIFPSQTAPWRSWAVVQASLFSVSCLTFVLSALNHLCKGCWSCTDPSIRLPQVTAGR